jgi:hypothetical protein
MAPKVASPYPWKPLFEGQFGLKAIFCGRYKCPANLKLEPNRVAADIIKFAFIEEVTKPQLFDHDSDPSEKKDLSADNPDKLADSRVSIRGGTRRILIRCGSHIRTCREKKVEEPTSSH